MKAPNNTPEGILASLETLSVGVRPERKGKKDHDRQ